MLEDILLFVVAFISEVIGAIAGFGSSTIFLPLALFFVDFETALILVAISHIFGNLGRINFFRHGIDKEIIATFGIPSILFSFLGASIVGILSQDILKVILGAFLIIISALFLVKPSLKVPTNRNIAGGLDFIVAESWPNAIHEGNGTALFLVPNKANEEQKGANTDRFRTSKGRRPFCIICW